jgi:hypothetical protein
VTWYSCIASSSAACVFDVGEDGPADETDDPLPRRPVLFDHLGPENVRRHEVGRELDAIEPEMDGLGELLDQEGLGQPRNAS